jgi:hypothetical protein
MSASNKNILATEYDPKLSAITWLAVAAQGCEITKSNKVQHRKTKTCLRVNCNIEHDHNNSFCSAECCKAYRNGLL